MKEDSSLEVIEYYKKRALTAERKIRKIKEVIKDNVDCTLEELLEDGGVLTEKGEALKAVLKIIIGGSAKVHPASNRKETNEAR